ncbi:hypothetical protein Fcan01_14666 [Folsomia candida]|uniref:EB domain-containing protein n=2 Tax=Folsomia candida TaxID=158441 RepID=A0A226DZW8_FOLCA|nr:hypothetical protein Fcan01_14666 [Folsomia candida]
MPPNFLAILFLSFLTVSLTTGQFYNARCTHNGHCNASQFLSCYAGYCQCDSRSQVYDHALTQCVIRPGGKCFFERGNHQGLKCSKNSVCISGICQCEPGHWIPKGGEVLCKPNFENQCKNCDAAKGLVCIKGTCQCRNPSLSYQGMFGCVEAKNPDFIKMMATLKETEKLLKENRVDINTLVDELALGEKSSSSSDLVEHRAQPRQLFNLEANPFGTIDSVSDLTTSPQTQGGGIFGAINSLGSLFGQMRQNNQQQAYGVPATTTGGGNNQGGYGGGGTSGGYSGPAQTQNFRNNFPLLTNFLNLFNQIIPFLRRLSMLLNPLRFIQRLLTSFRTLFPTGGAGLGGLGLGGLGLGLRGNNNNQGGYSGGGGSGGGGSTPSSGYGPPGSGNTGTGRPSAAYGPPAASAINSFNQITPIQPQQGGQQPSGQQSPPSALSSPNFESQASTYLPLNNNKRQVPGFPNNNNNIQSFFNQNNNNNQNFDNNQNNFNQNNNDNVVNDPPIIALPSTQSQQNVKYPRQERANNFGDDSSPYLPEHL